MNVHIIPDGFSVRFENLSDRMWTMLAEIETDSIKPVHIGSILFKSNLA